MVTTMIGSTMTDSLTKSLTIVEKNKLANILLEEDFLNKFMLYSKDIHRK